VLLAVLSGCATVGASLASSVSSKMAANLSHAFVNYDDLTTVETAVPAYLLMVDSFLMDSPDNESLLLTASKLYTSYTGAFVKDTERAQKLTQKGFRYALRAACNRHREACAVTELPLDQFQAFLNTTTQADLPVLYALGGAWAAELQAHRSDWNAIAQLPRIESIMDRVLSLDETFEDGGAHLYRGIFYTLIPPALGGRPEEARKHFERALAISGKKNLMAFVLFAKHYARMLFDRELHDRLLNEVLTSDPRVDGYVLVNMAAQAEAKLMIAAADTYF
jgi:tetratricopeptide (TPR) repeat protein